MPIGGNSDQPLGANGALKTFWTIVKRSENWFHLMCLYPKCPNFNGEFNCFIFPTNFARGYVAILMKCANTMMETVDQVEVVDAAMCLLDAFAGSAVCLPECCTRKGHKDKACMLRSEPQHPVHFWDMGPRKSQEFAMVEMRFGCLSRGSSHPFLHHDGLIISS